MSSGLKINLNFMDRELNLTFTLYNLLFPLGQKNEIARFRNAKGNFTSIPSPMRANFCFYYKI